MKILDYIYYRIAEYYKSYTTLSGEKILHKSSYMTAAMFVGLSVTMNIASFLFMLFPLKSTNLGVLTGSVFGLGFIATFLFCDKNKYYELEEKYKNEKSKTLKGLLVLLYLVFTFFLFTYVTFSK